MAFNKYKIKRSSGDIETHEIFLDKLAKDRETKIGLTEKKFEVPLKEKVVYALFALFFVLALLLFAKTFYFQINLGKQMRAAAELNKGSIGLVRPERGIIYDKNMQRLVLNSPDFNLVCDKKKISENDLETNGIAKVLGQKKYDVLDKINGTEDQTVLLAENIPQDVLLVLEAKMADFKDCRIEPNTAREYVTGPIFSQILGYMGKVSKSELQSLQNYTTTDFTGKTGLENFYESYLRGTPGRVKVSKNAIGQEQENVVLSESVPGNNLVLNIDADLQKVIYDSLGKSIKRIGAKKGAAVAMDPRTGAVLALVSYPSYDDNIFSQGISKTDYQKFLNDPGQPFFNRAIAAHYPTGSTIKPFEALAALQEELISPTKLINDPGYILVRSQYDPTVTYRFGGVAPHGLVDMRKAIAVSSNIYFYTIGGGYGSQKGLGPTRIKNYLQLFGWGQKTGIDLPGEFAGFIPNPEWKLKTKKTAWFDGDTYNLSIGQSDLQVTPLQLAVAYCSIANGGTLYKPQIVQKIIGNSGNNNIIKEFKPEIIRQNFIDPQNLQIVREGMRDGVIKPYGLSAYLKDLPVAVAAKTGTAEIGKVNHYNVWSSVFAPYDNPQIVLVVTIEDVNGLGAATLPVAHDTLQWLFGPKATQTPVPTPTLTPTVIPVLPTVIPAQAGIQSPGTNTGSEINVDSRFRGNDTSVSSTPIITTEPTQPLGEN